MEKTLDERLEQIGQKSCKLIANKFEENKPKFERLLSHIEKWLEKKLT
jgi:hypothetical protein